MNRVARWALSPWDCQVAPVIFPGVCSKPGVVRCCPREVPVGTSSPPWGAHRTVDMMDVRTGTIHFLRSCRRCFADPTATTHRRGPPIYYR